MSNKGFSLIELIIVSSVFTLLATSFVSVYLFSNKVNRVSGDKARAVFLAEEGLEAVRNIRDENFSNLADGTYGLVISGGQWIFSGVNDVTDIFTRSLTISTINTDTKEITSTVVWGAKNYSLKTRLSNWTKEVVTTFNSCAEFCQAQSYSDGICRKNKGQCNANGEIFEAQGNQYCSTDPQQNTCCCN